LFSGRLVDPESDEPEVEKVVRMDPYEYIRTAHRVYGMGIRQISRETGRTRTTIRNVLGQELPEYKN
jgi:lambda repressor-like predicted transcriptional regulator